MNKNINQYCWIIDKEGLQILIPNKKIIPITTTNNVEIIRLVPITKFLFEFGKYLIIDWSNPIRASKAMRDIEEIIATEIPISSIE